MKRIKSLTTLSLVAATFVTAAFAGPVLAQSGAIVGEIQGVVRDPSGAAIAGAKVTASNTGNGVVRETTTDPTGVYHLPLLPLGAYKVAVQALGFSKYELSGLSLTAGAIATVDANLKVGAISESVTVTGEGDRKSTRLNSSHIQKSRMPSSA